MEKKLTPLVVTDSDEAQGIVETVFAVYGNVDDGGDVMHPGAFAKTFRERGSKVRVLDQHKTDSIMRALGRPLELRELTRAELPPSVADEYPEATGGAYARIQFLMNTPEGQGAFERIKAGVVSEWSFGYDAIQKDHSQVNGQRVRNLREVKLYELGPVLWGMNPATSTISAKAASEGKPWAVFPVEDRWCVYKLDENGERDGTPLGCHDTEDEAEQHVAALYANAEEGEDDMGKSSKGAIPLQDIPLADRNRGWDGTAAVRRVRDWAGYDPGDAEAMNWSQYRRAFLWYDQDNADTLQAYKLPYADVIDGDLTAIPRGLFAVAAVLQGGRGGVDIPEADQERVKATVGRWYARMREAFDDDGIVPAWEKAAPAVWLVDVAEEELEDKAVNLSGYVTELAGAFYHAYPDVLEGDERRVLFVEEVWDSFLVVREEHAAGSGLYRVDYRVEDGQPLFTDREEWTMGQRVFAPLPEQMQTTAKEDTDDKAGRVLAARNATRIGQALAALIEVLTDAGVDVPGSDNETQDQEQEDQSNDKADAQEDVARAGAGPSPTPTPRRAGAELAEASPTTDTDLLRQINVELAEIGFVSID